MSIKRCFLDTVEGKLVWGVVVERPFEDVCFKGNDGPDKLGVGHRNGEISRPRE